MCCLMTLSLASSDNLEKMGSKTEGDAQLKQALMAAASLGSKKTQGTSLKGCLEREFGNIRHMLRKAHVGEKIQKGVNALMENSHHDWI